MARARQGGDGAGGAGTRSANLVRTRSRTGRALQAEAVDLPFHRSMAAAQSMSIGS